MEIRWLKKGQKSRICTKDVRLSVGSGGKQFRAVFFNGTDKNFGKTEYIQTGICGNRLYFRNCDSGDGSKFVAMKISSHFNSTSKELIDFAKKHKAEYLLEYDVENNLYYIEDNESNV